MEDSPFGIMGDERTAVFIDGPNLYAVSKLTQIEIDFKKMLAHFVDNTRFVRAYYFTAVATDDEDYSPIKPLIDWLAYNGYTLITKPMKEFTDESGRRRFKGNMDVDLTVQVMKLVANKAVDHVVLFSGDGNFRPLIEAVQDHGVRVTVVSALKGGGDSAFASDDLRRQADKFVDIPDVANIITRPKRNPEVVSARR